MIHDVILSRAGVVLRPLSVVDAPALRALVDADMWAGMSTPLPPDDEAMADHVSGMVATSTLLAFAVEFEGRVVGRTTLYDLVPGLREEWPGVRAALEVRLAVT